ncbi:MAG: hypothetical protein WC707_01610 [Candidatus Babeliaceae bacterium]|jgi:hypothetical protein
MHKLQKSFLLYLLIFSIGPSHAMLQNRNKIARESITHVTGLAHLIRENNQQKRTMGFGVVFGPVVNFVSPIVVAGAKAVGFTSFAGFTIWGANNKREAIYRKMEMDNKLNDEMNKRMQADPTGNFHIINGVVCEEIDGEWKDVNRKREPVNFMPYKAPDYSDEVKKELERRIAENKRDITPPTPPTLTGCGTTKPIEFEINPGCGDRNPIQVPTHTGHVNNPPLSDLDRKPGCGSSTPVQVPTHTGHINPVPVSNPIILAMARDPNSPRYAPGPPKADEIRDKDGGQPKHDWKPKKGWDGEIGRYTVGDDKVTGYPHKDGCVFEPTGEGTPLAHGGPHYDVQTGRNCSQVSGDYVNVYPGKPTKDANGKPISEAKGMGKSTTVKFEALGTINAAIDTSTASISAAATESIAMLSASAPSAPSSGSGYSLGRLFWGAQQSAPVSPIVSAPTKQSEAPIKKADAPVKQMSNAPEKKADAAPQKQEQPSAQARDVKMPDTMSLARDKDGNTIMINSKDRGNPNATSVGAPVKSDQKDSYGMPIGTVYVPKKPMKDKDDKPWYAPSIYSTPYQPTKEEKWDQDIRDWERKHRGGW